MIRIPKDVPVEVTLRDGGLVLGVTAKVTSAIEDLVLVEHPGMPQSSRAYPRDRVRLVS
jgi:hypothetical protein